MISLWGAFKKCDHHERFCDNPPDLRGAGDAAAAKCHEDIVKYLQSIALNIRVQFQWCCNADYSKALDAYEAATAKAKIPLKKSQESTARYFRRMLRRSSFAGSIWFCSSRNRLSPRRRRWPARKA
ncbi:hypothetical protein OH491_27590 (plasmid) [Termitidicoccus mucosus]|uniref:hypothetical protein n=1 Tax=Termitidicoccus mucosus TaxID=1184151 RepID=UPI0031843548